MASVSVVVLSENYSLITTVCLWVSCIVSLTAAVWEIDVIKPGLSARNEWQNSLNTLTHCRLNLILKLEFKLINLIVKKFENFKKLIKWEKVNSWQK